MSARIRLFVLAILAVAAAACGDVIREGRAPVILLVNQLAATSGQGGTLSSTLLSDVIVLIRSPAPCTPLEPCPTVFNDVGTATLGLAMKDVTVTPSTNNQVVINRYTVRFRRNDGRNVPGVDVPYPFDGAVTATVTPGGSTSVGFELVRHVAKEESPLVQLVANPNIIATIADVTFYGQDLVGNDVSATGSMLVQFGNFGDF